LVGVRLWVLLAFSWATILVVVLAALLLPLFLGRTVFSLLRVPEKYYHDPFAFAIGVGMCWALQKWVVRFQHRLTMANFRMWVRGA
jgi:hypothetical protein